jgi:molecular chaperone HtpG
MENQPTTRAFETEVKQILDLMIHSVYSQKEIFLRELISNASDALDKRRFEENLNPDMASPEDKEIRLTPNRDLKTLTIEDNGIGMTYDEVVKNIGTIAYSGSKDFVGKLKAAQNKPELIGQFGVGFYSSFMVAHRVSLHTRKAGDPSDTGTYWESAGDGHYTVEKREKATPGTQIVLHLKDLSQDTDREGDGQMAQDFTDHWTLKEVVRKYSDFIDFPVKMKETRQEPVKDEEGKDVEGKTTEVTVDETLNSQKALWMRQPADIKPEEYKEFYKHLTHDWTEPRDHIHYKAEGTQEFASLIYIPGAVPFNYNNRDEKYGLSLYVKKVFILDRCEDLIPTYLRFLKGVVDSSDLPLNVSREILQKDRRLESIKKALVSKVLRHLKGTLDKNRSDYEGFWKNFGSTLKEGIPSDYVNKKSLVDLALFRSTHSEGWTTLAEYVARMKPEQKQIYFITGDSMTQLAKSPYLEALTDKGYEVLYGIDPVDEWVMGSLDEYQDKKFASITKENLDLDTAEEKKAKEEKRKTKEKDYDLIKSVLLGHLKDQVKEVKISDRLVSSPVCLVSGAQDPSAHMERLFEAMGQAMPKSKRILEINGDHPVFEKMAGFSEDRQKIWAQILYNQALLNEGSPIEDPTLFTKQISDLMMDAHI